MSALRRILREPLLHFLLAGAALYLLHALFGGGDEDADARRIVVDRPALLRFMQYQARAFEPGTFEAELQALGPAERQRLVDDYIREEVLYREAQALGLAQGDYVMRQRLVQKMSFLLEQDPGAEPDEAVLQAYLEANAGLYRVEPSWTFTHVYLDPAEHGGDSGAEQAARQVLDRLNRARAGFNDAPRFGDRFAFLQNYVERTSDYVVSHFGEDFAAALEQLPVDAAAWQGPLQSLYGWHLVMLTARTSARLPELSEIRARVLDDFQREQAALLQEQALAELISRYDVELRGLDAAP